MSISEVLREMRALSHADKLRLLQALAEELIREESDLLEPGRSYPVWSPDRAFTAADALLQALSEEKGHT